MKGISHSKTCFLEWAMQGKHKYILIIKKINLLKSCMWPAFPNECECRTISNEMIGETGGLRDVTYDKNVELRIL